MKKKCTFAAKLLNVIFIMVLVARKLGTFSTNKILTLAGMRTNLFVSMGFLIPLDADRVKSAILFIKNTKHYEK